MTQLRALFLTGALAVMPMTAVAASLGSLKVCKKDNADDWGPELWNRQIVVPAGVVFADVGPIDSVTEPRIKLRIVIVRSVTLNGKERCKTVEGAIQRDRGDWGRGRVGPVITRIKPGDNRLLEVESWGDGNAAPKQLYPWGEVVPIEATVEREFR